MKTKYLKQICLMLFIVNNYCLKAQISKDIKLKVSLGAYGLTPPSEKYVDEYQFSRTLNYSLGLVKDFKINKKGNWLLKSEILYNKTFIKVGIEGESSALDRLYRFRLDQILLPLKLAYVQNNFNIFVGLVPNWNFSTQKKEFDDLAFEQVGTYNYDANQGATLFKNTFVDRTVAIQYVLGFELVGKKGHAFGLEFIDYFGYKNYYRKYFGNTYDISQISSSAINVYASFVLDRE